MESERECPFCGVTSDLSPVVTAGTVPPGEDIYGVAMECTNCFAAGPRAFGNSPREALEYAKKAWLYRTGEGR